ncbi:MAG: hypothetical protein Q9191_004018 [Dirinaria sp. TL-2023a]
MSGTTRAVCTESQNVISGPDIALSDASAAGASMTDGDVSGPQTATLSASEITFLPVVVTAGGKAAQKPLQTTAAGKTTAGGASKTGASAAAHSTGGVGGRMDLAGFGAGVGAAAVGVVAAML